MKRLELFNSATGAEYLGVAPSTLHEVARKHGIGQRVGHILIFTKEELDAWADAPRDGRGRPRKGGGLREQAVQAAR